ncbi:MAG TPA: glutaredoxin domain-containing protein [Candidatus Paceibacterota bacterium]
MTNQKTVKIYSTPTCVWCRAAKDFFGERGIVYEDHNVAADMQAREYMFKRTGQMGVPVIEVGNDVVIGFDEEKISHLLGIS